MTFKPIMKDIKIKAVFCPNCKEQAQGDGSSINRYNCKCGTWYPSLGSNPREYKIYEEGGDNSFNKKKDIKINLGFRGLPNTRL